MANRSPLLSPISKSIHSQVQLPSGKYEKPIFDLPDDITLLPSDDFHVNDSIRKTEVPPLELARRGGDALKKNASSEKRGKRGARREKKSLMGKFKRVMRVSNATAKTGEIVEEGVNGVRRERKSRTSRMANKAGTVLTDTSVTAGAKAVKHTGRLTGKILYIGAMATRMAVNAAAPHLKTGGNAIAKAAFATIHGPDDQTLSKMNKKERAEWFAACVIQRNYRIHFNSGPKYNRAARIITEAIRDYISMINREKWFMVIEMEKQDRLEKEERIARKAEKDEKKAKLKKQIRRAGAEKAAKSVGWGSSAMKTAKWTVREEAIMCACFFKHGFPSDDSKWATFYQFFPDKPRRAIRTKLNSMKEDGALQDQNTMQAISKNEIKQMGLHVHVKKVTKKKVIELKDLMKG